MAEYLVIFDIPSIKKFVFGTDRLKEIRGASALLDNLNRKRLKTFFEDSLNKKGEIIIIYSNGGSGQLIIKEADEETVKATLTAVKKRFQVETCGGARLCTGWAPFSGSDYEKARNEAFFMLQHEKEMGFPPFPSIHRAWQKECVSCSSGIAWILDKTENNDDWICEVCSLKRQISNYHIWDEFVKYYQSHNSKSEDFRCERLRQFEDIEKYSPYMALLYADGNAMGHWVKRINDPETFKFFASTVDQAIRQATYHALMKEFSFYKKTLRFPADILLLGGDDLVAVLPAYCALPFASCVSEEFEQITAEKIKEWNLKRPDSVFRDLNGRGFTISIGIAVSKPSYPFRILLEQAEALLKLAKKKGSADPEVRAGYVPSYIDYHITLQSSKTDVSTIRDTSYLNKVTADTFCNATMRPLSRKQLNALIEQARLLKDNDFPRTKLHRLYEASFSSYSQAQLGTIEIYSRLKNDERKLLHQALESFNCFTCLPWNAEKKTMIPDLVDAIELFMMEREVIRDE